MPIKILQEREKQKSLVVIFTIALILIFLVVYFGFFQKGKSPIGLAPVAPKPREIKIDFGILESEFLRGLEEFEWASLPTEKGRENPFLPY